MPVHTIKIDYDTKKLLRELLNEMKNMNHERRNPPRRYSDQPRHTPPPNKKR